MARLIGELRPVYVVGIGWHRYQDPSETSYAELGLAAARAALTDAGIVWEAVESSYVATARLGMAAGRPMLGHLGATGAPIVQVENASASGSAAFRLACIEVASGISDCAMVLGVDKVAARSSIRADKKLPTLAEDAVAPVTHYALVMDEYLSRNTATPEDIAHVAVKNHRNGALNPNAQRQKRRSLEEVLGGRRIAGALTSLQCTPIGEGAACVIVSSEEAVRRLGIDAGRAVRVLSSSAASEGLSDLLRADTALSRETIARAMADAQVSPSQLDVAEFHDAFAIEEALYGEAAGLSAEGAFLHDLKEGAFDIGGRCAISPSGGLIAMGHPIGPTGVGQIAEIALQLRGEAGPRQQPAARTGMAHMVGLGAVCYVHMLQR